MSKLTRPDDQMDADREDERATRMLSLAIVLSIGLVIVIVWAISRAYGT